MIYRLRWVPILISGLLATLILHIALGAIAVAPRHFVAFVGARTLQTTEYERRLAHLSDRVASVYTPTQPVTTVLDIQKYQRLNDEIHCLPMLGVAGDNRWGVVGRPGGNTFP